MLQLTQEIKEDGKREEKSTRDLQQLAQRVEKSGNWHLMDPMRTILTMATLPCQCICRAHSSQGLACGRITHTCNVSSVEVNNMIASIIANYVPPNSLHCQGAATRRRKKIPATKRMNSGFNPTWTHAEGGRKFEPVLVSHSPKAAAPASGSDVLEPARAMARTLRAKGWQQPLGLLAAAQGRWKT